MNMSLYDEVTPESLLAWQRVRVANQMAASGKEWAEVIDTYNSGTYNNQYMVSQFVHETDNNNNKYEQLRLPAWYSDLCS